VVEQQVTGPIETAIGGIAGVTGTRSTSTSGSSLVVANLEYGFDLAELSSQFQRAVQGLNLPTGVIPKVVTTSTDSLPVMQLAVSSNLDADRVAAVLRDQVRPLLAGLDGVAEVTLSGIRDPQITIDVDTAAATAHGVSLSSIAALLQANGGRLPAGQLSPDTNPLTVEVGSPITSVEALTDLYVLPALGSTGSTAGAQAGQTRPLAPSSNRGQPAPRASPGGSVSPRAAVPTTAPVRLGDIATITAAHAPATGYTRTNGVPSVGIGVTKKTQANTLAVADEVRGALPRITEMLGGAARKANVTVVLDQAPFIRQSVDDLTREGLLGLVFAVLVILGFLLSVRATLVTAVSIPLSVLVAMIVLDLGGYTLNLLTLGALAVAIGRVVDDSIVVIENITRHLRDGRARRAAIVDAVREVAGAITASTVTTVAVFAPIGFVGGEVGELFRPFAVTVTAALLGSLLVSLTVVPVLCSAMLRPQAGLRDRPRRQRPWMQRSYRLLLLAAVRRPVISVLVAVGILGGTVALVPRLHTNFLGDAGGDALTVNQELAPGTGLPQADAAARRVEGVLAATPGVRSYQVTVGSPEGGAVGFGTASQGSTTTFSVTLDAKTDAAAVRDDLRRRLVALGGPDQPRQLTVQGGFDHDTLAVSVRAADPAVLARAAAQVQQLVESVPGAADVRNNLAAAQPTVAVAVDRRKAAQLGLTEAQIGQSVATALRGSTAGTLTIGGVAQPVVVRAGAAPGDLAALRALPLAGARGTIRLSDVASVTQRSTAPSISHTDGARSAEITARAAADDLGAITAALQAKLATLALPAGAHAQLGGVSTAQNDAFAQLGWALLVAIAVVYLVLVVTFRSLLQPLLLLVAIPFAATGAVGLLLLTGTPLGVAALIGMLMLVGIVVTNAIVLVDRVNQHRRDGRALLEAVIEGAAQRLRPILMTAVATVFALLPMGLGLIGGGVFISQPLAIVVIGGLASSTLLTLVLVPVLYVLAARRVKHKTPAAVPDMMTAATLPAIEPAVLRTRHGRSSPRDGDISGYFGS
jgi:HAE1 family hydrophobic/amphiphilic exporter-1